MNTFLSLWKISQMKNPIKIHKQTSRRTNSSLKSFKVQRELQAMLAKNISMQKLS